MKGSFIVLLQVAVVGMAMDSGPTRDLADSWPATGISVCQKIKEKTVREVCVDCFTQAGANFAEIRRCVRTYFPRPIANCGVVSNVRNFGFCIQETKALKEAEDQRGEVLYKNGGDILEAVMKSRVVKNGGAAMLSSMAQELFIQEKSNRKDRSVLQNLIQSECKDCFERFVINTANEHWHLPPQERPQYTPSYAVRSRSRNLDSIKANNLNKRTASLDHQLPSKARKLQYSYGAMGHDMPFHGVGPLALEVLLGECVLEKLTETSELQSMVDTLLSDGYPVPAWIFQGLLNEITSITLPD